jgi:hypothetical protein
VPGRKKRRAALQREPGKRKITMTDMATADGRNSLIERAFDLPFGYRATFICRLDGLEVR